MPLLSEEAYFWMTLDPAVPYSLCDRAILLCFTGSDDIATFRAILVGRTELNNAVLQNYPVDMHALGSVATRKWDTFVRRFFKSFADLLGTNTIYYQTDTPSGSKTKSVQALDPRRSTRLPPGMDISSRNKVAKSAPLTPSTTLNLPRMLPRKRQRTPERTRT